MDLDRLKLALETPRHLSPESAWVQHIPFAFALVDLLRPRSIVELGTYTGDSYCAWCQGVDMLQLPARCCAIDTWAGDAQTGGYSPAVLEELRAYHDPLYARFSRLVQATFDAAAHEFAANSVDLLHIDGCHSYQAVRHDLETWLPKMSESGVVLLHDTQVRESGFGVLRLWGEIAPRYASFEFTHGYGLGVLAVGTRLPRDFQEFLEWVAVSPGLVRAWFSALGARIEFARGIAHLAEASSVAQERWREALESADGAANQVACCPGEPAPPRALLEPDMNLKQWIDRSVEKMTHHGQLARRLGQERRAARVQLAALREQLAVMRDALARHVPVEDSPPSLAGASVYWPDAQGHYAADHMRVCYVHADGRPHATAFQLEMPAAGPTGQAEFRGLRFDPGDRPALWLIRRLSLRVIGPSACEPVPLPADVFGRIQGILLLRIPGRLDSVPGPHYVLLCHSVDPQVELRIASLLPAGEAAVELSMECRVWDNFGAFAHAAGNLRGPIASVLSDALGHLAWPPDLIPSALPNPTLTLEPDLFGTQI